MRKYIDLVNEKLTEDEMTKGEIRRDTWTYWQDHDGIYVVRPGSNSCFAGFANQEEALHFAAEQGPEWKVVRWGKFKNMSDEEAMAEHDVRHKRIMHGFWVPPSTQGMTEDVAVAQDEDEFEEQPDPEYERQRRVEKALLDFCRSEVGMEVADGYNLSYDPSDNKISITPDMEEITLVQLNKLGTLGDVTVNASSRAWTLTIEIVTTPGFDISRAS